MRIQLLSDLHFEFHQDKGRSFVNSLKPKGIDVLVLAGDVTMGEEIPRALGWFCEHYRDAQILYVHGNHEFYQSDRPRILRITKKVVDQYENLHWLDGDAIEINGQRFLGAPLWFKKDERARNQERFLNDFHMIYDYRNWVYEENQRHVSFLSRELCKGDVVITHYLPSRASILSEYRGSPLNAFFLCDMTELIYEKMPILWMHGHTHGSIDKTFECGTRLLCNPFGYLGHEVNKHFRKRLVVDL